MSDDAQAIVALLFFLILLGVLIVPFLLFFGYVFYQTFKRKSIRNRVLQTRAQTIGNLPTMPLRHCDERRFKSWFKIFPWEGAGVLLATPETAYFFGEHLNGNPVNLQFDRNNATIAWLGKCPWPNGAVSLFLVESQGQKHYFTSETGPFVFGSDKSTRTAFNAAQISLR